MISLLAEKYPDRHYTGLDLTPAMIEQAKKKNISNATFVVGDCENFPFEKDSFDAIICSMSFHHYPDPQAFFDSVKRCLRPNGRLILRDVTSDNKVLVWLMNTLEMPLANICGHGDVQVPTRDVVIKCCKKAGLKVEKFEIHGLVAPQQIIFELGFIASETRQRQTRRNAHRAFGRQAALPDFFCNRCQRQQVVVVVYGLVPLDRLPPGATNKKAPAKL